MIFWKIWSTDWDLSTDDKQYELESTRILIAGWSWQHSRYDCGYFKFENGAFRLRHQKARLPHPWKEKAGRSLTFIGDYEGEYMVELNRILADRFGEADRQDAKSDVEFNYEPIEALHALLNRSSNTEGLGAIGGSPQLVKIYQYGNSLPIVIRSEAAGHYLLGRRLFSWEKTEYPVLDLLTLPPAVIYPMSEIPVPAALQRASTNQTDDGGTTPTLPLESV